jgi:riboflavin kinase/FMN adenylyltransferase
MGETPMLLKMKIHNGIEEFRNLPPGLALSIGNFDGLHRGHRRIIELAKSLNAPAGVAIATFEPHPLTVLAPEHAPPRLTPTDLKTDLLREAGVDHLVILPPTPGLLNLTAEEFWEILRDEVRPDHLIEGDTFNFGKGRGGNIDRLREWSAGTRVQLHIVDPVQMPLLDMHVTPISSSLIRWLIVGGRVRDAAICLGQPYTLQGNVVKGFQRGRTIGVPTANLDCGEQLLPAEGVYVGRCNIDGKEYPAAVSIGRLPTFEEDQLQIEAHLIGFTGDLYGQKLRLQLIDWVRDQQKFPGIEALKSQLAKDIELTKSRWTLDPARPIAHA